MSKKTTGTGGHSRRGTADNDDKAAASKKAAKKTRKRSAAPDDEGSPKPFAVVGIGASAGGLAALRTFFSHVPEHSGIAYVVVVHLSPTHKSHLADLLQPHVRMPVQQVTETVKLEKDHVYVIPPNANLNAVDTHLRLSELEEQRQRRAPIDHFFRTLAKTQDGQAIAVVLTGTGSDGTLGVRDIKEKGGICIVQDPDEAEYDGMPRSALETGVVDVVLPLAEIPEALLRIVNTRPQLPAVEDGQELDSPHNTLLQKVLVQVRARTGRDFSRYKQPTLVRRVQRRMQLRHVPELSDYVDLLRKQPDEARVLGDDLLITVTSFFRDPAVYEKLEDDVVPQLFAQKGANDEIRVWSVGCATGEEAYSIAMLLLEEESRRKSDCRIQIFASDLHDQSLRRAREGFYPGDIETDVPPARLERFFTRANGGYRVRKELREVVVFTPHNLMGDPPFSRLDLVLCRNVMIYLQRDVQREIVDLFHYALKPDGWLVLGTSETVDTGDLFRVEHKKLSVYRKRDVPPPEPRLPVFPRSRGIAARDDAPREHPARPVAYETVFHRMVEHYGPPSALVSPDDKVVHFSDHAGRFFSNPRGGPTDNVFQLIRPELQPELRAVLHTVRESAAPASSGPVTVAFDNETGVVDLHVCPSLAPQRDGCVLIVFEELPTDAAAPAGAAPAKTAAKADESERVRWLEAERHRLQQRLQGMAEEYETSREEARSSSEEMQSTNEELRSTMEELETSKEELQSMNEELQTVNQENRHKVAELSQLSSDLQNLMAATSIATLFLDRELRILRFTPPVEALFRIRAADRGRPLADLTNRLHYEDLAADAANVLKTLVPLERELRDDAGRWYLTGVRPYRSTDDQIQGIVITFVDISARRSAEERVRDSERRLAAELEASQRLHRLGELLIQQDDFDAFHEDVIDAAMAIMRSNCASLQLLVQTEANGSHEDRLHLRAWRGFHPQSARFWEWVDASSASACGLAIRDGERRVIPDLEGSGEVTGEDLDECRRSGIRAVQTTLLKSRSGALLGAISTHWREPHAPSQSDLNTFDLLARQVADLIEQKRNEAALRASERRLRRLMNVEGVGVAIFDGSGHILHASDAFQQMIGLDEQSQAQFTWQRLAPPEHADLARELWRELVHDGRIGPYEKEYQRRDGTRSWMIFAGAALGDGTFANYCLDIGDWKRAESKLREQERRFRALVEQVQDYAIFMLDLNGRPTSWNEGVKRLLGFKEREFVGQDVLPRIFTDEDVAAGIHKRELEDAAATGSASNDRWMRRKDGSLFWATGMTTVLHDEEGRQLGFMKVMRDQTDRKRMEEEQQRLAASLADANRRKDEFIATLAHEIRNPLAPIRTAAAILRGENLDAGTLNRTLDMIERQSRQLVRLMDDLLDVSRITRGKLELRVRRAELAEIVDAAVEAARPAIDDAGHTLTLTLPERPVVVEADATRLTQVVSNLLNNAAKFTPRGGRVDLVVEHRRGDVVIAVRDTGIGIGEELLQRVFEMFAQGEAPGAGSGLGIGLTLVKSIVEMHGGRVEIESDGAGHGTTVRVTLPIVSDAEALESSDDATETVSGLRILIVDDRRDAADTLASVLESFGNDVRVAYDGRSALETGRELHPDAVVLDIGMPDVDGYETARAIRSEPWGEKPLLVALTGWGQAEDKKKTKEAGFDFHLVKPADISQLCGLLRRAKDE